MLSSSLMIRRLCSLVLLGSLVLAASGDDGWSYSAYFERARGAADGNDGQARKDDGDVTPQALLAKLHRCSHVSNAPYATDVGNKPTVDICGLRNAVY